jgi:hypothetical protein
VTREGFARGRSAFGQDEQFRAVVGGTFAVKDTGIGSPVDRFSIDDGELANLEGFGQTETVLYCQDGHRGKRERRCIPS